MIKLFFLLGCLSLQLLNVEAQACRRIFGEQCPHPDIHFWMFDAQHPEGRRMRPNMGAGAVPHPRAQMKVLIHDFDGNRNSVPNNVVRSELLRAPGEFNVITMEFPTLVQDPCFNTAVENSPAIGRCLAQFLYSFVKQGLVHPRDIHLIGHGIGAHIAGFAAKTLRGLQIRLGHITGLDPAKHPSFTSIDKRLDVSDAQFVDIIHTDVMQYGKREPIGHVDFYVNMGLAQPDCRTGEYFTSHSCNHVRAADIYEESFMPGLGFWGFRCRDLDDFLSGVCKPNNNVEQLGFPVRPTARGNYFLITNYNPPYARGLNFDSMNPVDWNRLNLNQTSPNEPQVWWPDNPDEETGPNSPERPEQQPTYPEYPGQQPGANNPGNPVYPPGTPGNPSGTPGFPVTPPETTGYPPGTTGYPPGTTGYPPGTTGYPPGSPGNPVYFPEIPGTAGYPPGSTGYPPGTTGYPPGTTGYPPGTTGTPPGIPGYPGAPDFPGTPPGATGYPPGTTGNPVYFPENPGTTGYPPGTTGHPPGTTGLPPGTTGYPPGTTGLPPGSPENPGTNGYPPGTTSYPPGTTGLPPGSPGNPVYFPENPGTNGYPSGTTSYPPGSTGNLPDNPNSPIKNPPVYPIGPPQFPEVIIPEIPTVTIFPGGPAGVSQIGPGNFCLAPNGPCCDVTCCSVIMSCDPVRFP